MTLPTLLLAVIAILLSALSQLLMKAGMMIQPVQQALDSQEGFIRTAWTIIQSPLVISGLSSFGLSMALWLYVLAKMQVSQAYPLVALGIVATALGGYFAFGDALSPIRLAGIGFITVGVFLVALS
jgi:multidrug transporter EmrE-like cation transporter